MPFDTPAEPAFGGETRAFPRMSFEEMQQMAAAPQPSEPPPFETLGAPVEPEASPWDETPAAFGGETRAFPSMSFEEMEKMASAPSVSHDPFAEPLPSETPFAAEE